MDWLPASPATSGCAHLGRILFAQALSKGLFARASTSNGGSLDLHDMSEGTALHAVRWWLETKVPQLLHSPSRPDVLTLITGWGKSRNVWGQSDVKACVSAFLSNLQIPWHVSRANIGLLEIPRNGIRVACDGLEQKGC